MVEPLDTISSDLAGLKLPLTPIGGLQPRKKAVIRGVVTSLSYSAKENPQVLQALVNDETGILLIRWLGIDTIRGLSLGTAIEAAGVITIVSNRFAMTNPEYRLVSDD